MITALQQAVSRAHIAWARRHQPWTLYEDPGDRLDLLPTRQDELDAILLEQAELEFIRLEIAEAS